MTSVILCWNLVTGCLICLHEIVMSWKVHSESWKSSIDRQLLFNFCEHIKFTYMILKPSYSYSQPYRALANILWVRHLNAWRKGPLFMLPNPMKSTDHKSWCEEKHHEQDIHRLCGFISSRSWLLDRFEWTIRGHRTRALAEESGVFNRIKTVPRRRAEIRAVIEGRGNAANPETNEQHDYRNTRPRTLYVIPAVPEGRTAVDGDVEDKYRKEYENCYRGLKKGLFVSFYFFRRIISRQFRQREGRTIAML